MKPRELKKLGFRKGPLLDAARAAVDQARFEGLKKREIRTVLHALVQDPASFHGHPFLGPLAALLLPGPGSAPQPAVPLDAPVPCAVFGQDIEPGALRQMENACRLPVAVAGALMPDAHQGYGLPIGGVLAVRGAVIPHAVGVDIACRMRLSVLDLPLGLLARRPALFRRALERETRFGVGAAFSRPLEHAVMDLDWGVSPVTAREKDTAWRQLGTSGGGNHFVEFVSVEVEEGDLGLEPGCYLGLLSHGGSRGPGARVAEHYSRLARRLRPGLPRRMSQLAWLDLDSGEGQEYWGAMELMGHFAAAGHELIHDRILRRLGARARLVIENHHNFAWKAMLRGEEVVIHRKGATPAEQGRLGIIPGTMGSEGFVVAGLGNPASLWSAAHGAGRRMSRKQALARYDDQDLRHALRRRGVELLSGTPDEIPQAYKDIRQVMAAQQDLVRPLARLMPRMVRMA